MKVHIVGLGRMGAEYCRRLAGQGHDVAGYDVSAASVDAVRESGVKPLTSLRDAVADEVPILLSLPDARVVTSVVEELVKSPTASPMGVIDLSTTGARGARQVSSLLAYAGFRYAEAPVSGGISGARSGTLTLMAAGDEELLEEAKPLLRELGHVVVLGKKPGMGQAMKVFNNLLSATNLAITSEAVAAGAAFGLSPQQMIEVFNAGSGRNAATADKFPRFVLSGSFDQGFATSLMTKDVLLAQELLHEYRAPAWVAAAVTETWLAACREIGEESDFTEVARFHARLLFGESSSTQNIYRGAEADE